MQPSVLILPGIRVHGLASRVLRARLPPPQAPSFKLRVVKAACGDMLPKVLGRAVGANNFPPHRGVRPHRQSGALRVGLAQHPPKIAFAVAQDDDPGARAGGGNVLARGRQSNS